MSDKVVKLRPKAAADAASLTVKIATSSGHLGRVANKTLSWLDLCKRLGQTAWDSITMKEFRAKPIAWQHKRKNQGYFVGGHFKTGARKLQTLNERSVLTFDIDNCTPALLGDIELGSTWLGDYEYFYYTTRSHTKEQPRVRVVVPLAEPIAVPALNPLTRIIAERLDKAMEAVDPVSFRPAQVMYWPNTCRGSEFLSGRNEGPLLDGNAELVAWGDWKDYSTLPKSPREKALREHGDKAQDPFTKRGSVGAFARAYPISAAIETFLSDVYELGDQGTDEQPRYSYLPGSTRNGAVVYEDDRFLYSNHGTDPVADTLVNSWDLVRIHKFADKDKPDANGFVADSVTELPSYKAMLEFVTDDKAYIRELRDDQYDLDAVFTDVVDADEIVEDFKETTTDVAAAVKATPKKVETRPEVTSAPEDWKDKLEITEKGLIRMTLHNLTLILGNDPRFRGCIAYNEFIEREVLVRRIRSKQYRHDTGPVKNKENGDFIDTLIESTIRVILESPRGEGKSGYSLRVPDRDMKEAIIRAAAENRFHPIRNYLKRLKWDGKPRIGSMLHRYAHVENNEYHREVGSKMMIGAVARAFEPGCKFDFVAILEGDQGIRKSSFIRALAGASRFGELSADFDDKAKVVENLQGKWLLEIPELSQFSRTEIETLKAMWSTQSEHVRLAWARSSKDYPRQCVFWGSTNKSVYLKDKENRRYWPVKVPAKTLDTDGLLAVRDQLWAEAYAEYQWLREVDPNYENDLPLYLQGEAARVQKEVTSSRTEVNPDEILAGQISAWLDRPVPEEVASCGYRGDAMDDIDNGGPLVIRNRTCLKDIMFYVMGRKDSESDLRLSQQLSRIMGDLPGWKRHGVLVRLRSLGPQRVFDRIDHDDPSWDL